MRALLFLWMPALCAAAGADAADIIRRSVDRDQNNWRLARNYTFVQRVEERKLDRKGNVQSTETRTEEVIFLYGRPYERLIAIDDKPLDPGKERKEQERLARETARRKRDFESEDKRRKQEAEFEKARQRERKFLLELPEAFDFRLAGEEVQQGRDCWMIDGTPKPGYRPKDVRGAKLLPKFKGRLWIDKSEYEWVRAEIESIETVSFGLFLARLGKGARIVFEQKKINDEIWLPLAVRLRFDARLGLVSNFRRDLDITFRDWRKFQSESRILTTEGSPPE
jgi:predicted nuclease of restriction endonuclease-like (RecB) superfamily